MNTSRAPAASPTPTAQRRETFIKPRCLLSDLSQPPTLTPHSPNLSQSPQSLTNLSHVSLHHAGNGCRAGVLSRSCPCPSRLMVADLISKPVGSPPKTCSPNTSQPVGAHQPQHNSQLGPTNQVSHPTAHRLAHTVPPWLFPAHLLLLSPNKDNLWIWHRPWSHKKPSKRTVSTSLCCPCRWCFGET